MEGFTRALHRLVPRLPAGNYSGLRRRILGLNPSLHDALQDSSPNEPVAIAVDSTGVKVNRAGG